MQLDTLPNDKAVGNDLCNSLEPYLFEAGLDPDNLNTERRIIVDSLMMYQVIDKRRHELEELAKGVVLSIMQVVYMFHESK